MNDRPTHVLVVGATGSIGRLVALDDEPADVRADVARLASH
jgi:hypothetical protein